MFYPIINTRRWIFVCLDADLASLADSLRDSSRVPPPSSETQRRLAGARGNKSGKEMKPRRLTSKAALLVNLRRFISLPDLFPLAPVNRPWVSDTPPRVSAETSLSQCVLSVIWESRAGDRAEKRLRMRAVDSFWRVFDRLICTAPQMIPRPEMIPKLDRK